MAMLDEVDRGTAAATVRRIVTALEPSLVDDVHRVDAHADGDRSYLVIAATAGAAAADRDPQAVAADVIAALAPLWSTVALSGAGTFKVGLDLTIDGQTWVVEHADMLWLNGDVVHR